MGKEGEKEKVTLWGSGNCQRVSNCQGVRVAAGKQRCTSGGGGSYHPTPDYQLVLNAAAPVLEPFIWS